MAKSQPTAARIRSAQKNAVGGMRKRCKKGKNCSAACIQAGMACLVWMPVPVSVSIGKVSSMLSKRAPSAPSGMKRELSALGRGGGVPSAPNSKAKWGTDQLRDQLNAAKKLGRKDLVDRIEKELARRGEPIDIKAKTLGKSVIPASNISGGTRYARGDAKDFDNNLRNSQLQRVGDSKYDGWKDSHGSGAKAVGEGSYGTVIKNKDGTFVKRGAISDTEADLIKTLGERGIGPKLIAADINGKHSWHEEDFVNIRNGRIAMTQVPGKPMGETAQESTNFGGKQAADVYWKAMGDLHRLGIAHNDAHIDNIMVDDKGTGRWVDLGLGQRNRKAAFAEAFGAFSDDARNSTKYGNWQTAQWDGTGIPKLGKLKDTRPQDVDSYLNQYPVFGRVARNRDRVESQLRRMGFSEQEISRIEATPIRSNPEVFEQGPWAKMTDQQAQNLIEMMYDGV